MNKNCNTDFYLSAITQCNQTKNKCIENNNNHY